MSRLRTLSLAIKERLEEIPEFAGKVVVFRRYDIESEFERRMAKARGSCVVVRLIRGTNTSRKKLKARFAGLFTVSIFTAPLLTRRDAKSADELIEEVAEKLHGWWPEDVPSNGAIWCECGTITYPEDVDYDVTTITVDAPGSSN